MFRFEVINELVLKATSVDGLGCIYTKAGAMIAHQGSNKFEKVLLGPQKSVGQAVLGQLKRRLTGENLPLMKCTSCNGSLSFYADNARHVVIVDLNYGETLMVESEDLLAFNDQCKYDSRIFGLGVISQKGFCTSVITGQGENAQMAILSTGNPLVLKSPCAADPDALIAWSGADPEMALDVSFRNFLGRGGASGESYQFKWTQPGSTVIVQPSERASGVKLSID